MSATQAILVILIGLSIMGISGMAIAGTLLDYHYERAIGAHMNMAVDLIAPEQILQELNATKNAMIAEGLTPDMSAALIFKKPDNMMAFQYQHLDAIMERTQAVMDWKSKAYSNSTGMPLETTDIYQQKIDNLRNYITQEARSDWIAKDAWLLNKHGTFFLLSRVVVPCLVALFILSLIGLKMVTE